MAKLQWRIQVLAGCAIQHRNGSVTHISVLSRRTARKVFSRRWPRRGVSFSGRIYIGSGFCILGYQPDTGLMIAIKEV